MQKHSPDTSAGLLRWLMAAQTGLLPTQPITAQINLGLSLWLDEKRGSRQLDSKLRACDLVRLRVSDAARGGVLRQRSVVIQQKTGRPVPVEITEPARDAIAARLSVPRQPEDDWPFPSRSRCGQHIGARPYAGLIDRWRR